MFAVFKTGGKQYRVAADDVLKVDKIKGERGEIVEFGEVFVVGGDAVTLGMPTVAGATVAAEVVEQAAVRRSSPSRSAAARTHAAGAGFARSSRSLRITEILTDGKKPSKTASQTEAPSGGRPGEAPAEGAPEAPVG